MLFPVNPRGFVLFSLPKNATIAEIGVNNGDFSARLLKVTDPKQLFLIDPWLYFDTDDYKESHYGGRNTNQAGMDAKHDKVNARFANEIAAGKIVIKRAKSADAATDFDDGFFDCVYIDGDHSYAGVKTDIEAYFPKLKAGGLMVGDDYNLGAWWGDGVCRAFNEFLATGLAIVEYKVGNQIAIKKL